MIFGVFFIFDLFLELVSNERMKVSSSDRIRGGSLLDSSEWRRTCVARRMLVGMCCTNVVRDEDSRSAMGYLLYGMAENVSSSDRIRGGSLLDSREVW